MDFFKDKAAEAKAAVESGNPERAADIVYHAFLEGGEQNLVSTMDKLSDELRQQKRS
ncbi:hypothetical protein ACIPW5_11340 [Streptomyces sp. NPDC090077]|uniref:hypothetical protein n=1 Tax=Streptomyces sp. NPDC090077 TaxID=3365938 RepID=UPI00381AECB0